MIINRTAISAIIRDHRTEGLNTSTTRETGPPHATNTEAAANESWVVRCSLMGFSRSNPRDINQGR